MIDALGARNVILFALLLSLLLLVELRFFYFGFFSEISIILLLKFPLS